MQSITAGRDQGNIKLEKLIMTLYPALSYSTLQKAFRKKDIKVNGVRVGRDHLVMPGDLLEIYIVDELLSGSGFSIPDDPNRANRFFTIVYEDDNVILVNKMQGIPVHPDKEQASHTLIDLVREYLKRSDASHFAGNARFQPSLCHRLDRNTGGLVLIAKNESVHQALLEKMEGQEIRKYYQCLVKGRMEKPKDNLRAYLWKDAGKSRVFVSSTRSAGALEIITGYKVLRYDPVKDISLLEVELITGRTHQIRAHLALIGHPVIGDGKYGSNEVNKALGLKWQALWAYKLRFVFETSSPLLEELNGREFQIKPQFPSWVMGGNH